MTVALLAVGAVLVVVGALVMASGRRRHRPPPRRIVLDLRESAPVIDLTEVGHVWTAMPASSSRRVR